MKSENVRNAAFLGVKNKSTARKPFVSAALRTAQVAQDDCCSSPMPPDCAPLAQSYACLKSTRRGKHIYPFSYYHVALIDNLPQLSTELATIRKGLNLDIAPFNVVKLDASHRISFLFYEDFAASFPALLTADSCDLDHHTVRHTDYTRRSNPPILHRKELLLPEDHPLVPEAAGITGRLESQGAFKSTATIGTRLGWQRRLGELRLDVTGRPLK